MCEHIKRTEQEEKDGSRSDFDRLYYPPIECGDSYDCCDCGGNECGCSYCFSCNACEECLNEE